MNYKQGIAKPAPGCGPDNQQGWPKEVDENFQVFAEGE
jgi:hypothetical protein